MCIFYIDFFCVEVEALQNSIFYPCIFSPHVVCCVVFRWFGFMLMCIVYLSHCLLIYTGFTKWKPNRKKETTFSKWKHCLGRRSNGLQCHGLLEQNQRKLIRWLPWNLLPSCCICCGLAGALLSFSIFFFLMSVLKGEVVKQDLYIRMPAMFCLNTKLAVKFWMAPVWKRTLLGWKITVFYVIWMRAKHVFPFEMEIIVCDYLTLHTRIFLSHIYYVIITQINNAVKCNQVPSTSMLLYLFFYPGKGRIFPPS